MTNYLKRFIYVGADGKNKMNPLIYPFLFSTLLYGLGFFLLGDWTGVSSSSLFTAMYSVGNFIPSLWGAVAAVAGVLGFLTIALRKVLLGEIPAFLGFLVWTFAAWMYVVNNYWLVLLTVALPNLYFWVWWFFRVKWYERERKAGRIVDPS